MKNAVILHGKPKKEKYFDLSLPKPHEANWLPTVGAELESRGVEVSTPALPAPYAPKYSAWRQVVDKLLINEQTGLIGLSAGAGFLVRYLSESPDLQVERVVLIAPWHDRDHKYGKDLFDYTIDPNLAKRAGRITIFNSLDDGVNIQAGVAMLREAIPGVHYRKFQDYGHFMLGNNMTSNELPELIEELFTD